MSTVLKSSNNITLFHKTTDFICLQGLVCVQNGGSNIISTPLPSTSWRIDRHFVNKHGGLEGSYGSFEIVQNKKGKAST